MTQFLLTDSVRLSVSVNALADVAHEIGKTGCSAQELHGDATAWAQARVQEWQGRGTDAFVNPAADANLRHFLIYGAIASCVFAVLFIPGSWLSGNAGAHISFLIAPVLMGFIAVAFSLAFQRLNATRGFGTATAAATGIIIAGAALTALMFFQIQKLTDNTVSVWWLVPVAIACAVLAWTLDRALPDRHYQRELALIRTSLKTDGTSLESIEKSSTFDPRDAGAWETLFLGELRSSGFFTEASAQQEVSRVRGESERTHQHPYSLFGHPVTYARSLPGNLNLKRKRLGIFFIVICALWASLLAYSGVDNGWDWSTPELYLYLVLVVLSAWRAVSYLRK